MGVHLTSSTNSLCISSVRNYSTCTHAHTAQCASWFSFMEFRRQDFLSSINCAVQRYRMCNEAILKP